MIIATCHCEAVTLHIPRKPRVLSECNCTYCRRLNPLFAYCVRRSVQVTAAPGQLESYIWGHGRLEWFRCKKCGCFTYHEPAKGKGPDRYMGINFRMVDPQLLNGITVKRRDGAAGTWALMGSYKIDAVVPNKSSKPTR
jgi:hypothetical protein